MPPNTQSYFINPFVSRMDVFPLRINNSILLYGYLIGMANRMQSWIPPIYLKYLYVFDLIYIGQRKPGSSCYPVPLCSLKIQAFLPFLYIITLFRGLLALWIPRKWNEEVRAVHLKGGLVWLKNILRNTLVCLDPQSYAPLCFYLLLIKPILFIMKCERPDYHLDFNLEVAMEKQNKTQDSSNEDPIDFPSSFVLTDGFTIPSAHLVLSLKSGGGMYNTGKPFCL